MGLVALFWSTGLIFSMWSDAGVWITVGVRLLLAAVVAAAAVALFTLAVVRSDRLPAGARRAATVLFSLLSAFLLLEVGFMFVPRSHGYGNTLAARVWEAYYWRPVNALGFRDSEVAADNGSTYNVLVVGDSFTEGHGLKSVEERYSDLLASALGTGYRVCNLGRCGADTAQEYQLLLDYPVKPDLIVLQYFANDIENVCAGLGRPFAAPPPYADVPGALRAVVRGSFVLDYLYWRLPQAGTLPIAKVDAQYEEWLTACYADQTTLSRHVADLAAIVDYSREHGCPLVVVVFPFLGESLRTANSVLPVVESFLAARHVPLLSVGSIATTLPAQDRVVNASDTHASPELNSRVAAALVPMVRRARASGAELSQPRGPLPR